MNTEHTPTDTYLAAFVADVRERYGDNLRAVLVYGSYVEGYFDPEESDYDILLFLGRQPDPEHRPAVEQKFPKVSLMYYLTMEELEERIRNGSWSLYIAVLKGAATLYQDTAFERFVADLEKVDMRKIISSEEGLQKIRDKFEDEINTQTESEGFEAIKWFIPTLRRMLQIHTYLRTHKTVWSLEDNLKTAQTVLDDDDMAFIKDVQQRLLYRSTEFSPDDTRRAAAILENLGNTVVDKLSTEAARSG